MVRLLDSLSH